MHDLDVDDDASTEYECLHCGEITSAESNPGRCPSCDRAGAFQQRGMSLE